MSEDSQRSLMRRYLDGELSESEAALFVEDLHSRPDLQAELTAYERIEAVGRGLEPAQAPDGFADRVMSRVAQRGARRRGRWAVRSNTGRVLVAMAASLVVGFGLGRVPSGTLEPSSTAELVMNSVTVAPVAFHPTDSGERPLRVVRMTYVATDGSPQSVSVAGSFNGWNPALVPMSQEGRVWSAILVLPAGTYEYMFLENGERWVTDPLAPRTREDGFGGRNAVLDIGV